MPGIERPNTEPRCTESPSTESPRADPSGTPSPGPGPADAARPSSVPACMLCGSAAESAGAAALSWVRDRDDRGRDRWLCPACARRHVRDIEAKLDPEWW